MQQAVIGASCPTIHPSTQEEKERHKQVDRRPVAWPSHCRRSLPAVIPLNRRLVD